MRRRDFVYPSFFALLLATTAVVWAAPPPAAVSCASLQRLQLPETTIVSATDVAGPSFAPPGAPALNDLPAFCRVVGVTKPSVRFEVWLPLANWNGKFQGVGNGGTAGIISYSALAAGVRRGYATASTDTGHVSKDSADSTWAAGRLDLVADFGYRGMHVATENGKKVTTSLYQAPPRYSYYVGCSKGGQQGLMEAQRFPDDYDGLIAGAPAANSTRSYLVGHLWPALATEKDPESYIPPAKVPLLAAAVTAACDANDGIRDGVLQDPRACTFDPEALACRAGQDAASCFTTKQIAAVKAIWAGARNAKGELLYQPMVPGAESGAGAWERYVTGSGPGQGRHQALADGFLKYVIFNNPAYDFRTFNYDVDLPAALEKVGPLVDAVDPRLQPLERRGSKLIVYHGWNDPSIPAQNSVDYYEAVVGALGGTSNRQAALARTQAFYRLFLVPGMQHCSGGPGTDRFDMLTALENWVEKGIAPDRVTASHATGGRAARTRPLCMYPQVAVYTGSGSTDDAANFACR